jgi:hypothetical protein
LHETFYKLEVKHLKRVRERMIYFNSLNSGGLRKRYKQYVKLQSTKNIKELNGGYRLLHIYKQNSTLVSALNRMLIYICIYLYALIENILDMTEMILHKEESIHASYINIYRLLHSVQDVPGVKVTTSGFISGVDAESKTSYTHGSNSQKFRSYEFLKYSK